MFHLHRYRTVTIDRMERYSECRCGRRTWTPYVVGGYWPVDHAWLAGKGEKPWDRPMPPPPRTASGNR
jgi:CDGSH-type Zn-finger protein